MRTQVPADLMPLTAEALGELEAALVAEFDEMHDSGEVDLEVATEIADALDAVRARQVEVAAEAEEAAAELDRLAAKIKGEADDDEAEPTETVAETDENEGETDENGDPAPEAADAENAPETAAEPEPVLASTPRRNTPRVRVPTARRNDVPAVSQDGMVSLTAAADIPGYAAGASIDVLGIARAMHDRARALSNGSTPAPIAQVHLPYTDDARLGNDPHANLDIIDRITTQRDAAALTASGWCAPSNNVYDLFEVESADGLLDLPSVQVTRGGINLPDFIGFGAAAGALWTWDEDDQDAALDNSGSQSDALKPCLRIPCPGFTDYRLEADGLCLTHGNLTDRAWPELTARFVRLTVTSHLHRMSQRRIAQIVADATAVAMGAGDSDAAGDLLGAVDVQVATFRSQYRLANTAVIEVGMPHWTREALRANLAKRAGVALTNITNADVDAHFAVRAIRPQYLHDYQPLWTGSQVTAFPATFKFLMWVAGSYLLGDGGVIDLGVVRDSKLNETNDYTAAWTEQAHIVARRGPAAKEVTATLAYDGVTACCPLPEEGNG